MSDEQKFNPLDLISKEDRKRLLKSHTKTQLLKKAMTWELIAQQYKEQLIKLQKDKDE
tara:strand:+ start:730 stop:903 length:174 start_codon:yes stop_codon:yes gene_type:complete